MIVNPFHLKRRWLAPEVVQTSAMDCGPAALKCLLEGFSIPVSYGRLREACQTDIDGTSIDTLETVALQLGLTAEQIMLPVDHVLLPAANTLPALAVVRLPSGVTHFVVIWRTVGPLVQVMDPGVGRRWLTRQQLLDELYVHSMVAPADDWRTWAGSAEFLDPLRQRLAALGISAVECEQPLAAGLADPSWRTLAALDAATRMVTAIVRADGLRRGAEASRALAHFFQQASGDVETVPKNYWSVWPVTNEDEASGETDLYLRGAILVRIHGKSALPIAPPAHGGEAPAEGAEPERLSPELVAALAEPPSRPSLELLKWLRGDGLLAPAVLLFALLLAAGAVVLEALLLRGLLDLGRWLGPTLQRSFTIALILVFAFILLTLDWVLTYNSLRMGRKLENRLRMAFLTKLPQLGDRYFQSRLVSDMAERSHSIHKLRLLPDLGRQLLRTTFEVILTAVGIIWLAPDSAWLTVLATLCAVGVPLLANAPLLAQDLRVRTHLGALGRFYHDAMLGLTPIRAHGAEQAVRREHESLLVEWARASQHFLVTMITFEGVQMLLGFGLATWLIFRHLTQGGDAAGILLLAYWALNLPVLGQELVLAARQYPALRNTTLRMLEPLGAPVEEHSTSKIEAANPAEFAQASQGVAIALQNVTVRVAGHTILNDISLTLAPGSQVAIVGASGAGKSSLVGLLLGWHRPAAGQLWVDGQPLTSERLVQLRQVTAWVDPAVQLWNRSLLENLRYGGPPDRVAPLDPIIAQADLLSVLEKMNDGLQTVLGEGGALVSGGEGQRVRLGRAMLRDGVRLVILDEPFRGLDREKRRSLLQRARHWWQDATLLCITHDVSETQQFDRVLVLEGGQIVEDGVPQELAAQPDSRYRALLDAEMAVRTGLWSDAQWRRLWLEEGQVR